MPLPRLHEFRRLAADRLRKRRRKRYGAYDSRGRLAGKRLISGRPAEVEARGSVGHWEADTVMGADSKDCVAAGMGEVFS